MGFERAVEHLLELHARAEARMEKAEARMEKAEVRMERAEARMDRIEKQVLELQKMMRVVVRMMTQLIKAQRRTDERFDRLIQILSREGKNGGRRNS